MTSAAASVATEGNSQQCSPGQENRAVVLSPGAATAPPTTMVGTTGGGGGAFDYSRHYRHIFKEAKKLAEFQVYDPKEDKVRKRKTRGFLLRTAVVSGETSLPRAEYWARVNTHLLANFRGVDSAILASMSAQIRAQAPASEIREVVSRLRSFAKTLLMNSPSLSPTKSTNTATTTITSSPSSATTSPTDLSWALGTSLIPLSESMAEEAVCYGFATLTMVFLGYVNACAQVSPKEAAQLDAIERLLHGQDVDVQLPQPSPPPPPPLRAPLAQLPRPPAAAAPAPVPVPLSCSLVPSPGRGQSGYTTNTQGRVLPSAASPRVVESISPRFPRPIVSSGSFPTSSGWAQTPPRNNHQHAASRIEDEEDPFYTPPTTTYVPKTPSGFSQEHFEPVYLSWTPSSAAGYEGGHWSLSARGERTSSHTLTPHGNEQKSQIF